MIGWFEPGGFVPYPFHEMRHFRMRGERFQSIELTFQHLFREERVDMVVAGTAEPGDAVLHIGSVEEALVPLVRVACAWNEMVPGQCRHFPSAKLASSAFVHQYNRINVAAGFENGQANPLLREESHAF